jgi:hypothetical protein
MALPHPALRPLDGEITRLRDPIAIAAFWGWNDGGATATSAIRYLREDWGATEVAHLDPDRFFDLTVTRPRRRIVDGESVTRWPGVRFYVASPPGFERDVLFISGREPSLRWGEFVEAVASVLDAVGAKTLLLLGSRGALVPHTRPAPVGLADAGAGLETLLGLTSEGAGRYQGPTGVNTVLLLEMRKRGLEVGRLTVRVPSYIAVGPNARAVQALVEVLDRALGGGTRMGELGMQVDAFEEQIARAINDVEKPAELRAQILEMERVYDEAPPVAPSTPEGAEALPEADALLDDLEQMLREQRGDGGESAPSS